MIDTKELRKLAQAATPGPDGVSLSWIKLLQDFQQGASPAVITELLDRIEAAEKSDAESIAMYRKARGERDALRAELTDLRSRMTFRTSLIGRIEAEHDALRAKIEAMERQKPVATVRINVINGNPSVDFAPGLHYLHHNDKLYALPGAKGE